MLRAKKIINFQTKAESTQTILNRKFLKRVFIKIVSSNIDIDHWAAHEVSHLPLVLNSVLLYHLVKYLQHREIRVCQILYVCYQNATKKLPI